MNKKNNYNEKPLIGFYPFFSSLGETLPLIEIAKKYMNLGGKAVFFTNEFSTDVSNRFEILAENIGCKVVKIRYDKPKESLENILKINKKFHEGKLNPEKAYSKLFSKNSILQIINKINKEINAFQEEQIKILVSSFVFSTHFSTYIAGIPLVSLTSGTALPPYFESKYATFPFNMENIFTKLIPKAIKNRLINYYILKCRWNIRVYNKLAKNFNAPKKKRFIDLLSSEYTLIPDDINFLQLKPTKNFPIQNYIGPILPEKSFDKAFNVDDTDIFDNFKKDKRTILLTFGSQGAKYSYLKILNALNKTDYNVIAIYSVVLDDSEIPDLKQNICFKKFVSSIKNIHEKVDLVISHGGRGTVYTAAYSGKPVIGIPMQSEQQYNLDNLVRNGTAKILNKKNLNEKKILKAIDEIFNNYSKYHKNAQLLKENLSPPRGAENAAKRLLEISQNHNIY